MNNIQEWASTIVDRLRASANVNAVYCDARVINGRTIIPVAAVSYSFGAGGGTGKQPAGNDGQASEGSGGGGGGMVSAKPVAVIEVTDDRTRVVPVVDVNRLAFLGVVGLFIIVFFGRRWLK